MHVETVVLLSKKTGESRRKSIKIDGFPTSQKSGKSSFLLQKWFSGGKPVKTGLYSYGKIGQHQK